MENDNEQIQYSYPVKELDEIIEQINKGITPMITKDMEIEVKLRINELNRELNEEYGDTDIDDGLSNEELKFRQEMMRKKIENNKRKSSTDDVLIIKLKPEQKAKIREEMTYSIIRDNPNTDYNKPDEELYADKEEKEIYARLKRLKNVYYNQKDYQNAIEIIKDAVKYAIKTECKYMSKSEIMSKLKSGEIRFDYAPIPKLCIDGRMFISDRDILMGVITGDVTIKDRSEDKPRVFVDYKHDKPDLNQPIKLIGDNEYNTYYTLHKQGVDTPISPMIKRISNVYNRFSIKPTSKSLIGDDKGNIKPYDWLDDNAGSKYYDMNNNIKFDSTKMIDSLSKANNHQLSKSVNTELIDSFLRALKNPNADKRQTYSYIDLSNATTPDAKVIEAENDLLNAMRMNNPNI